MTLLCLILFISVVLSKSLVSECQKSVDGDAAMFIAIDFGLCYYIDETESTEFKRDGDKITIDYYSESSTCSGNKKSGTFSLDSKEIKGICDNDEDNTVEIKKAPKHIGFMGIVDDENCTHPDNTMRIYYTDKCYKCSDKYCNYEVDNGWMYLNEYPNDKCNTEERLTHEKEWECDKCDDGTLQQCGTVSTMILFVVFAIFALIL
ncbi:hypothetical protein CL6EHI_052410 [Entamoeba histolytica]|uniref:Uncharacterized protein n=3 Tax=Entamoeba histolytica TaxID=5759 RepID=C4MAD0_ENTH1|nr:hypothetical protein EHI_052410 [Entamoeba histolytica HM-1:IMSS]EAL43326.1 hypothetical protein EHI_052410 [Entamoeba histolytica HM-1:IMSS]EMD44159.1 Hypothetical protein EHI5A_245920 [Entamoeba histolytica KU27]GAT98736.1 hypothetical protein CL6EHI_052410 [Entamoeba histolytica]|eukprot:XP_648712.1 hypothetical protein EHI_052410 [Entamoeba histolytica HM-1:IMSS]